MTDSLPHPGLLHPSALFSVVTGRLEQVARLHRDGALGDGSEACILAAINGQLPVLEYLHRAGCDVSSVANRALPLAAAGGRLEVVKYFHRLGCDLRANNDAAIRAAAQKDELAVVEYLQRNGADISACSSVAEHLHEQGCDLRVEDNIALRITPAAGHEPGGREGAEHPWSGSTAPTVSILLANYNHAQYLPTALSGICGQTHPPTEIIVVDDGSTDASVAIVEDFAARFPAIQILKNGTNRGQHDSIQRALLAARGDYVVWAASDDLLLPDFLERSLDELRRNPEAGLCFSRLAVFVDGTDEIRDYTGQTHDSRFDYGESAHYLSPQRLAALLRDRYLWMSGNTVVARRLALLETGGFERALRWHADWFAYYVVALRYGACVIPETLALMRERRGTYSGSGIADSGEQRQVLAAIFDTIRSPKYADVFPAFRDHPSLLSLFGKPAFFVALRNPRDWRLAWALARWHGPRVPRWLFGKFRRWLASRRPGAPLTRND